MDKLLHKDSPLKSIKYNNLFPILVSFQSTPETFYVNRAHQPTIIRHILRVLMMLFSFFLLCKLTVVCLAEQSSLQQARALIPPKPRSKTGGEDEDSSFWADNAELLSDAWQEYGQLNPDLYDPGLLSQFISIDSVAGKSAVVWNSSAARRSDIRISKARRSDE